MPPSGERPSARRRNRPVTGEQGPEPLTMYPTGSSTGKADASSSYIADGYEDEGLDEPRQNTSAIRFDNPPTQSMRRTTGSSTQNIPVPPRRQTGTRELPRQRPTSPQAGSHVSAKSNKTVHWLLPVGIGMVAMLVLWVLGSSILAWSLQRYNDLRYGNPRTYQVNAVVGHNDSKAHPSHFIALNWNHQAVVVEFMGGDPSKSVNYVAPVYIAEDGSSPAPVTVEFRSVHVGGDPTKPDMIIHIRLPSQDQVSVFINDGTKFRPSNSNDKIKL